ncbi:hypothetical protein GCK72_011086 [Caenorhabditis remanei]|uniref:Uncharacterized protein n=1 Tax=Caenorhabditis remanei TaxID=31234 RepID=A0A6A5H8N5_CAERE|nr:hypothetical protein GCK72_011086 [Caenorhabditis remanei]KAF1762823.1 hypothetical protein GCK72_011086 [Caenorhabditis remanei]
MKSFDIEHFYLVSTDANIQQCARRHTQNGHSTFTLTTREYHKDEYTETRKNVNKEDFNKTNNPCTHCLVLRGRNLPLPDVRFSPINTKWLRCFHSV